MAWLFKNLPQDIIKLVYQKQGEFSAEKKRKVSLEYTVTKLLKDAYLSKEEKKDEPVRILDYANNKEIRIT